MAGGKKTRRKAQGPTERNRNCGQRETTEDTFTQEEEEFGSK
jgi:hypothetical protein